ncbi:hypothetical protein CDL12_11305 [Handroanthus impetiginosus]|uniref:CASP-like protein n=1 Tax=Handroanthus impetiginosus TaxID=429701 RepID=A0A2G9HEV4_9LAMI|nr:hypothetical protein CDL12_11305 [Handroanthus impetiginosus]
MASTYARTPENEKATEPLASEYPKTVATPRHVMAEPREPPRYFAVVEVVLRFLLLASAVVAVVVMVTSKQSKTLVIPISPFQISRTAKFQHSPAFIYFVAALSFAGFYSIITFLFSLHALLKPGYHPKVVSHFVILDVLLLGIMAAATGSAGGVAYIGLKGNSHVQWAKICDLFDDFCKHIGASIAVSLFGSIVLALLIVLSFYSLSKRIPK